MKRLVLVVIAALLVLFATTATATAAKKPTLASLAKAIKALQATNAKQTKQIKALQALTSTQGATIATIQSNSALALGPYVSVTASALNGVRGPHILFTGANLHIRSGSGATDDKVPSGGALTGLGNLIVGYDEPVSDGLPQPRTGSHNLIVGAEHTFPSYGGFVAGWRNGVLAPWTSVSGGVGNNADAKHSSVSGGISNLASGEFSSVSGGSQNEASGDYSSVSGHNNVTAAADFSWSVGGYTVPIPSP